MQPRYRRLQSRDLAEAEGGHHPSLQVTPHQALASRPIAIAEEDGEVFDVEGTLRGVGSGHWGPVKGSDPIEKKKTG